MHESQESPGLFGSRKIATSRKATTCDMCRDVVGPGEDPSCVYACPHNAAFRMTGPQLMEQIKANQRL